jgi:WhiB family transcriptional regulator, redox-sensing transcriptional regulator
MMVNSYYGIYQAERGKTTAEIRAADAQVGRLAAELGQLGSALAGLSPLTTVPRPRENGEQEVLAPVQWRDATAGRQDTRGLSLVLPCMEDPELFFADSPQDVEQAKAMCRGCRARLACLAGALERREPWGVWGGELLMSGAIVPRKRPRGRPRKDVVTIGANAWAATADLAQPG